MIKQQFIASILREWREIVRNNKLTTYLALALGYFAINLFLALISFTTSNYITGEIIVRSSSYGMISSYNAFILSIFVIIVIMLIRSSVVGELREGKMVLPYSMGLKPTVHIISKYIVQILVPSLIAYIMSIINGLISMLIFSQSEHLINSAGIPKVTVGVVFSSATTLLLMMIYYLVLLLSISTLTKRITIPVISTLAIFVLGDFLMDSLGLIAFTPRTVYYYALLMPTTESFIQFTFSVIITVAIIILLIVMSIMVYSDRNDHAI